MDRLADPATFAVTTLGVTPHRAQVRYLADRHPVKVLCGGRRSGKSYALAIEVVYFVARAIRDGEPCRQLIVAPAIDQARLLFASVASMLRSSPLGGLIMSEIQSPFPQLTLGNGIEIFVRSGSDGGKYLRGHNAHRAIIDEAAYVDDSLLEAILPTLADTDGQIVAASTPSATRGWFYAWFEQGKARDDDRVRSFMMTSQDNPFISARYVESQRSALPEAQYRQEYLGEFLDGARAVFAADDVARAAVSTEEAPRPGHRYTVGYDPALRVDRSAVAVVDVTAKPWRVVHAADLRGAEYVEQVQTVARTARRFNGAKVIIDSTAHGQVLLDLLRREGTWARGVTFTSRSKSELVSVLAVALEQGNLRLLARQDYVEEFERFEARIRPSGSVDYSAPRGGRVGDDWVVATALAVHFEAGTGGAMSFAEAGMAPFLKNAAAGIAASDLAGTAHVAAPGCLPLGAWALPPFIRH